MNIKDNVHIVKKNLNLKICLISQKGTNLIAISQNLKRIKKYKRCVDIFPK